MTDAEPTPSTSAETTSDARAPGDSAATGTTSEPSGLQVALTGCGILLFAVGGLIGLVVWFVSELTSGSGGGDRARPREELRSWDDVEADQGVEDRAGGRLTRTERRQLEAELERLERELGFAQQQLISSAGAGDQAAWLERIEELKSERNAVRQQLGR